MRPQAFPSSPSSQIFPPPLALQPWLAWPQGDIKGDVFWKMILWLLWFVNTQEIFSLMRTCIYLCTKIYIYIYMYPKKVCLYNVCIHRFQNLSTVNYVCALVCLSNLGLKQQQKTPGRYANQGTGAAAGASGTATGAATGALSTACVPPWKAAC